VKPRGNLGVGEAIFIYSNTEHKAKFFKPSRTLSDVEIVFNFVTSTLLKISWDPINIDGYRLFPRTRVRIV